MKHLLPFIVVCLSLVAVATIGASKDEGFEGVAVMSAPHTVTTDTLN